MYTRKGLRLIEDTTKIVKYYYWETSTVIRNLRDVCLFLKRETQQRDTLREKEGLNKKNTTVLLTKRKYKRVWDCSPGYSKLFVGTF